MSTARRYNNSYEDYLRLERESPLKLEYCDGEIFAMAGGSRSTARSPCKQVTLLRREGMGWTHQDFRSGEQFDLAGRAPIDVTALYSVVDDLS